MFSSSAQAPCALPFFPLRPDLGAAAACTGVAGAPALLQPAPSLPPAPARTTRTPPAPVRALHSPLHCPCPTLSPRNRGRAEPLPADSARHQGAAPSLLHAEPLQPRPPAGHRPKQSHHCSCRHEQTLTNRTDPTLLFSPAKFDLYNASPLRISWKTPWMYCIFSIEPHP
ncbi:hypothetical protein GQ55_5G470600 [Panicum hallii var. hallii]|uniref:Uncharacterized protein n=1 Tax=Panicum hallii var. hallii TaxID=1504633 RepID=A0A2T7DQT4_9POAL|nr:hypothetical protein GQ55_5G470600 [Panicum hallii var. hallii]